MDSWSVDEASKIDARVSPVTEVGDMARQGTHSVEDFIRNTIGKIRHWKLTSLGKKRPKWGFEFTIMTYNILSQAAADCHIYLYMKCNPQYLSEEYRISKILPEILKSKSDVVCLQEVEHCLYEQRIKQVFDKIGFGSIFKKRTGNKSDGCAILWRRDKFNLLKHHEVELKANGCDLLDRDNVGLIAVFKPRHPQASQTQLHVATTHLLFNPRRGDVKLCQLRLLLAELERSAFKATTENGRVYHPTIFCGDFNFEPHSPLCRFVENGRLDLSGLISGNMSGQQDGRDKGGKLKIGRMSMDQLGIDESGRYNRIQVLQMGVPVSHPASGNAPQGPALSKNLDSGTSQKDFVNSNGSQLDSYRLLMKMEAAHLQPRADLTTESDQIANSGRDEFLKDASPSSSSSSSESESKLVYHDFNFVSTYKYYHQDRRNFPVTCMTGKDTNTVDHIFYNVKQKSSTSYTEDQLKLLGVYALPFVDDVKDIGLPNADLGSDHFSLMSKFIINFKC